MSWTVTMPSPAGTTSFARTTESSVSASADVESTTASTAIASAIGDDLELTLVLELDELDDFDAFDSAPTMDIDRRLMRALAA